MNRPAKTGATKPPKVAAIIVNWNGRDLTLRLLESLQFSRGNAEMTVTVVDNGSVDDSVDAIRKAYPRVEVVALPRNVGYSAGVNAGLKHNRGKGYDYYWVFNNDVEAAPDALENLLAAMESDPAIGVAGPIVLDYITGDVVHGGYRINMWTGRMTELGGPNGDSPVEVDSAFGCSNLIRAETVERVGLFNPAYNVYFDETDYNTRVRAGGWKVAVVPSARVKHEESATMNRRMARKAWLLLKNLLLFEWNNASPAQLAVFFPYYLFIHVPYFIIRGMLFAIKYGFLGRKTN